MNFPRIFLIWWVFHLSIQRWNFSLMCNKVMFKTCQNFTMHNFITWNMFTIGWLFLPVTLSSKRSWERPKYIIYTCNIIYITNIILYIYYLLYPYIFSPSYLQFYLPYHIFFIPFYLFYTYIYIYYLNFNYLPRRRGV